VRRATVAHSKLGPLPARLRHGPVDLVAETLKDTHGSIARPYRAVDTIELLLQRGTITKKRRSPPISSAERSELPPSTRCGLRICHAFQVLAGAASSIRRHGRERALAMRLTRSVGKALWWRCAFGTSWVSNGASGDGAESRQA
jgi:hypothetical protein